MLCWENSVVCDEVVEKKANYKVLQMWGSKEEYRLGLGGGGGFVQRSEEEEMRVCVVMIRVGVEQKKKAEKGRIGKEG